MKKQNLIRILAALMLVFSITTMSSCTMVTDFLEGLSGDTSDSDGTNPETNQGEQQNNNQTVKPSPSIGEFYPGSGESSTDNVDALNRTLLSSVIVTTKDSYSASAGSGVIYHVDKAAGDAYIITNYHVVCTPNGTIASEINIYLYGMELSTYAIPAKFIGGSHDYEIAVLKVENSDVIRKSYATAVTFANSEQVNVFDTAYAVGNAEGFGFSVTKGIVSVESENLDMSGADGSEISIRVMRVDTPINQGNSGGGVFNDQGGLIGIVVAKRIGSDVDNMAYAIPSNLALSLVKNIIDYCDGVNMTQVNRVILGVTITSYVIGLDINEQTGEITRVEKVEVHTIVENGPSASVMQVGDVINSITIDGVTTAVTRTHHVPEAMLNARVGSTVVLNITRGGETFDVTFNISENYLTLQK